MSADSLPITRERFAKALADLSLSSLYLKVAELRNSIAHLEKSNGELEEYVRQEEDKDCYEAILENREVIKRMEERIELVKREVMEVRGLPWQPEDGEKIVEVGERRANGDVEMNGTSASAHSQTARTNGTVRETQNRDQGAEEEEGVFL